MKQARPRKYDEKYCKKREFSWMSVGTLCRGPHTRNGYSLWRCIASEARETRVYRKITPSSPHEFHEEKREHFKFRLIGHYTSKRFTAATEVKEVWEVSWLGRFSPIQPSSIKGSRYWPQ